MAQSGALGPNVRLFRVREGKRICLVCESSLFGLRKPRSTISTRVCTITSMLSNCCIFRGDTASKTTRQGNTFCSAKPGVHPTFRLSHIAEPLHLGGLEGDDLRRRLGGRTFELELPHVCSLRSFCVYNTRPVRIWGFSSGTKAHSEGHLRQYHLTAG